MQIYARYHVEVHPEEKGSSLLFWLKKTTHTHKNNGTL